MRSVTIAILTAGLLSSGAVAKIKVPYFDPIAEADLCGAIPKDCQPTSSQLWSKISDPIDYNGVPDGFIGRKYSQFYDRLACTPKVADTDVTTFGASEIQGKVVATAKPGLKAKIDVDVAKIATDLGAKLPENLKASLAAEIGSEINKALGQTVTVKYMRIQMNDEFRSRNLQACRDTTPKNQKIITGISVVSVTAEWTKTRIRNALTVFEGKVGFSGLSAEVKADFGQDKTKVLTGTFPTTAFVIRVAYEKGAAN